MIVFRQADPRYPFLWCDAFQPPARWHGEGDGPAHYFSDTPAGAWAELLRHEEITDPADLVTLRRALWAVEIGESEVEAVSLSEARLTGGLDTYAECQAHALRLRAGGARRLRAPSAALLRHGATGRAVGGGLETDAEPRDGQVLVCFEPTDHYTGWKAVDRGAPPLDVLARVRHFRG